MTQRIGAGSAARLRTIAANQRPDVLEDNADLLKNPQQS
jgi:hypothetical protein